MLVLALGHSLYMISQSLAAVSPMSDHSSPPSRLPFSSLSALSHPAPRLKTSHKSLSNIYAFPPRAGQDVLPSMQSDWDDIQEEEEMMAGVSWQSG